MTKIAVTSPSFSRSEVLRSAIERSFSDVKYNDQDAIHSERELIEFVGGANGLIVGLHQVTRPLLESCRSLEIISKYGVGLDNVPADLCGEFGVEIGWTGGVNRMAVAEQALALMISLSRNLYTGSQALKGGRWVKQGGRQLSELTVGIVGFGYIGQLLSRLLKPFGCRVIVHDVIDHGLLYTEIGVEPVSLSYLYEQSDVISLHVDLNEQSRFMINASSLKQMKPTAYLINTARGQIIKQEDLKHALITGEIAGAALDVYEEEPPTDREFLSLPNLICTPHIAGNSKAAVEAMGMSAIGHLERFFLRSSCESVHVIEGAA